MKVGIHYSSNYKKAVLLMTELINLDVGKPDLCTVQVKILEGRQAILAGVGKSVSKILSDLHSSLNGGIFIQIMNILYTIYMHIKFNLIIEVQGQLLKVLLFPFCSGGWTSSDQDGSTANNSNRVSFLINWLDSK